MRAATSGGVGGDLTGGVMILITGASGNVGTELVKILMARGPHFAP
jgi:NADPH:quinone reductase-like Zn-dependent oxidoreductase